MTPDEHSRVPPGSKPEIGQDDRVSGVDPSQAVRSSEDLATLSHSREALDQKRHQPSHLLIKDVALTELVEIAKALGIPFRNRVIETLFDCLKDAKLPRSGELAEELSMGPSCFVRTFDRYHLGNRSITRELDVTIGSIRPEESSLLLSFGCRPEPKGKVSIDLTVQWDEESAARLEQSPDTHRWAVLERALRTIGTQLPPNGTPIISGAIAFGTDRCEAGILPAEPCGINSPPGAIEEPTVSTTLQSSPLDFDDPHLSLHPLFSDFAIEYRDLDKDLRAQLFADHIPEDILPSEIETFVCERMGDEMTWEEGYNAAQKHSPHCTLRFVEKEGILLLVGPESSPQTMQEDFEALVERRKKLHEISFDKTTTPPNSIRLDRATRSEVVRVANRFNLQEAVEFIDAAFTEFVENKSPDKNYIITLASAEREFTLERTSHVGWDEENSYLFMSPNYELCFEVDGGLTRLILFPHEESSVALYPVETHSSDEWDEDDDPECPSNPRGGVDVQQFVAQQSREQTSVDLQLMWQPANGTDAWDPNEIARRWRDIGTLMAALNIAPIDPELKALSVAENDPCEFVVAGSEKRLRLERSSYMMNPASFNFDKK